MEEKKKEKKKRRDKTIEREMIEKEKNFNACCRERKDVLQSKEMENALQEKEEKEKKINRERMKEMIVSINVPFLHE